MMQVIGLCGPAGSGKDTAGAFLQERYGYTPIAFAAALKAGMKAMGMPEPEDRAMKEQPVPGFDFTWREAAQSLGTEWGRNLDPDIWMKMLMMKVTKGGRWVVTDVRFENEAEAIRGIGSVWHITGRKIDLGANAAHQSEKGVTVMPFDKQVANTGSIHQFYENLNRVIGVQVGNIK